MYIQDSTQIYLSWNQMIYSPLFVQVPWFMIQMHRQLKTPPKLLIFI